MIIEIIISHLDFLLIEKLRLVRLKAGLSQTALAHKIGVSEGFIGNIENHKQPTKLNIRLMSRIANACSVKSYSEIYPDGVTEYDLVRIVIDFFDKKTLENQSKINGEPVERFKIISINPLSEKEIEDYKKNIIKYRTIIKK
ncbi:helix-turn-helix domain-containing protein [Flavobacterium soli]|uniref:helix-turn-helix domain-containing protein n=1 Tax=Flavobacterium soli TaxID=344881 RepID=UPI000553FF64|nr:helix-turn-helix transcriptional regulator [Flavobacterium soli]